MSIIANGNQHLKAFVFDMMQLWNSYLSFGCVPYDLTILLDIFNYLGCSEGQETFCCGHLQLLVLTHNNLSCIKGGFG